jgi:hypothetical protein
MRRHSTGKHFNRSEMKKITGMAVMLYLLSSCFPDNTTPLAPPAGMGTAAFDTLKATLLKQGAFVGLDGPTSGTAKVYDSNGVKYVVFNPFMSHSGPDLHVYLSKDAHASDYINISKLQAVSGLQYYKIPGNPAITYYNYVHIWCQAYSVDFARAEIK